MMLSKQAGCAPRELASMIIANFPDSAEVEKIEIAGPGFINDTNDSINNTCNCSLFIFLPLFLINPIPKHLLFVF
jgi:hypothetical protein